MPITKIMLIRHGEKPTKHNPDKGVRPDGDVDENSLTVRGWQRAGALGYLLNQEVTQGVGSLAKPTCLFAAGQSNEHHSKRSIQTLDPLAKSLDLKVNTDYVRGREDKLVGAVLAQSGVVLIAWEHDAIRDIVSGLTNQIVQAPKWPDRYDMIYVLDANPWHLTQRPQMLLSGDLSQPFG